MSICFQKQKGCCDRELAIQKRVVQLIESNSFSKSCFILPSLPNIHYIQISIVSKYPFFSYNDGNIQISTK